MSVVVDLQGKEGWYYDKEKAKSKYMDGEVFISLYREIRSSVQRQKPADFNI